MGVAGLALGYFWTVVMVFSVVIAVPAAQDAAKSVMSVNQAKQITFASREYALDHEGRFPPSLDELLPDYLSDRKLFQSPFQPDSDSVGYEIVTGLTSSSPGDAVLVRDKYLSKRGRRAVARVDGSAQVIKEAP